MATVYSVRFTAQHGLQGSFTLVNNTEDVWILRDLDAFADNPGLSGGLWLLGHLGQTIWENDVNAAGTTYASWRGRQVIMPAESFIVKADVPADITVSGYQLTPS